MEVQFRDKSPNVELCAVILPLLLCGQCLVGGLWRAPVFPARPLVWGPCTLRTLCVTRTPSGLELSRTTQKGMALAGSTWSDCPGVSQRKAGATFPATGHRKNQPITPRVIRSVTKKNMTLCSCLWCFKLSGWVCTPVTRLQAPCREDCVLFLFFSSSSSYCFAVLE